MRSLRCTEVRLDHARVVAHVVGFAVGEYPDSPWPTERVLELFPPLKNLLGRMGGHLSGGEQQMLAISRALMSRPKLVLFDEPSLGLAPIMVETIGTMIADIRERGTTVLLVEQNASLALRLADRAYVLETGRITLTGPAAALIENPDVHRAYLGG
jgi:branched-chain amino acid transport system ATP-binding protein